MLKIEAAYVFLRPALRLLCLGNVESFIPYYPKY